MTPESIAESDHDGLQSTRITVTDLAIQLVSFSGELKIRVGKYLLVKADDRIEISAEENIRDVDIMRDYSDILRVEHKYVGGTKFSVRLTSGWRDFYQLDNFNTWRETPDGQAAQILEIMYTLWPPQRPPA